MQLYSNFYFDDFINCNIKSCNIKTKYFFLFFRNICMIKRYILKLTYKNKNNQIKTHQKK